ncbi:MAG: hypothetical protein ACKVQA_25115 [Burkholderiales bacterium]
MALAFLLGTTLLVVVLGLAKAGPENKAERERRTMEALVKARDALIGYALNATWPGSLPCPDQNNDGDSEFPNAPPSGSNCPTYVGRFPFKSTSIGIGDLRDSSGERLWYALSSNYRPHIGSIPTSETSGQLSVIGTIPSSDVIAVIIAPGAALPGQNRSPPETILPPLINPNKTDYLERLNADTNELQYEAAIEADDFNDRILVITRDMLMPLVQRRIAKEALNCLQAFAGVSGNRYPWAAQIIDTSDVFDMSGQEYGRFPTTIANSLNDLGLDPATPWLTPACAPALSNAATRNKWKLQIFYHVASNYTPPVSPSGCPLSGPGCLTVTTTYGSATRVVVAVMVAGRALPTGTPQSRLTPANQSVAANYLETDSGSGINNSDLIGQYAKAKQVSTGSTPFNDVTVCIDETSSTVCH